MSEHPQLSIRQLVAQIAEALGETESQPRDQIRRMIKIMGADFTQELLRETEIVEAQGGLFLERENRRRTPGGVFFYLARDRMTKQQRGKVFGGPQNQGQPVAPPFQAQDLPEVLQELTKQYGKASTVKITLIGRPTQVVERGDVVIFGLISDKQPALPKGLPAPPKETKYLVLVAKKQWNKVADVAKDAEDALILEGYPAYEPRHAGITVYALSVTTKKQQAAKREAQRAAAGGQQP
ncbi:MAG TPA: phosphorylated adapter RNA export RNA-binding domain-containing protein [Herpetosiphonaceae bacterium]